MRAECCILQPVNIRLGLVRNLSAGWYHGHPDIDIDGQLETFTVRTNSCSILSENEHVKTSMRLCPKLLTLSGVGISRYICSGNYQRTRFLSS